MNKIKVLKFNRSKKSFGLYRPNCEMSRTFAELLKQKMLTNENLETIKRLGFEIIEEAA